MQMKIVSAIALSFCLSGLAQAQLQPIAQSAQGQQSQQVERSVIQQQTGPQTISGQARMGRPAKAQLPVIHVGYRLSNWQTFHSHDDAQTKSTIATLNKLGCEVTQQAHGDHLDIRFRCPNWRSMPYSNPEHAQQWLKWLADNQFETVATNPDPQMAMPEVRLKMDQWKTFHLGDEAEALAAKQTYEMIGCEVQVNSHGNHFDTKIRCPNWVTIGLPNPQAAHQWQDWLNKTGFETEHDHKSDGHPANHAQPANLAQPSQPAGSAAVNPTANRVQTQQRK